MPAVNSAPTILQDDREIEGLWYDDGGSHEVGGPAGITKIEVYGEEISEGFDVAWFKIWKGDHLWIRTPAARCGITYKEAP